MAAARGRTRGAQSLRSVPLLAVYRPLIVHRPAATGLRVDHHPVDPRPARRPARSAPGLPQSPEEQRLLQVLLDKLRQTSRAGSYLPGSDDPILAPVLQWLERNPGETPSLQALATMANTTERTLLRRCQRDLGMSLAQWKQRLTVVRALERLETPMTVEAIALDLGYSSSSAFIGMFRRLMGVTPDEFRKARPHAGAQDGQA